MIKGCGPGAITGRQAQNEAKYDRLVKTKWNNM